MAIYEPNLYLSTKSNMSEEPIFNQFDWNDGVLHIFQLDSHKNIYSEDIIDISAGNWVAQRVVSSDSKRYYFYDIEYMDMIYPVNPMVTSDIEEAPILLITNRPKPTSANKKDSLKNYYEVFYNTTDYMLISKEYKISYTLYNDICVGICITLIEN